MSHQKRTASILILQDKYYNETLNPFATGNTLLCRWKYYTYHYVYITEETLASELWYMYKV